MTTDATARIQRLERQRRWMVRPIFFTAVAGTLAGNMAQAQPTVGARVGATLAPLALLACVEVLLRVTDVPKAYRAWGGLGVGIVGALALFTSYSHLLHFAQGIGWNRATAWTLPIFLDVVAIVMTVVLLGIGRRIAELEPVAFIAQEETASAEQREAEQAERAAEREAERANREAERTAQAEMRAPTQAERDALTLRERYGATLPVQRQIGADLTWGQGKVTKAVRAYKAIGEPVAEVTPAPV